MARLSWVVRPHDTFYPINVNNQLPVPILLADYISEDNWNAYVALLPEEDRQKAPGFAEAQQNIKGPAEMLVKAGQTVVFVEMDVEGWERWVRDHNKTFTCESQSQYCTHKYANESTGRDHKFINP